jgi:hypothetical protein
VVDTLAVLQSCQRINPRSPAPFQQPTVMANIGILA